MLKTPSSPQPCSSSPISGRVGVGRERRLAGAREAEEERHVAVRADVGRAVHRQHALRCGSRSFISVKIDFLISPAYCGAADQDLLLGEVEDHEVGGAGPVGGRVGRQRGGVEDHGLGLVLRELLVVGLDEEGAGEEGVPGALGDHAQRQAVGGLGAGERVDDVDRAGGEVVPQAGAEGEEMGLVDLLVADPTRRGPRCPARGRRTCPWARGRCGLRWRRPWRRREPARRLPP